MKKIFNNYKSSIILLLSIIIGTIIGLIFKDKASVLSPFGDLFLNMLLIIIVPLIFFTVSTSIGKMINPKRIGKILSTILLIFIITSLVSVFIGILVTKIKLVNYNDSSKIKEVLDYNASNNDEEINYLSKTINTISVNDFSKLLTKDNLIALIIFSILIGISINISKNKAILDFFDSACEVTQNFIKIIMYYAPIGLGCYFASLVGTFGGEIALGYGKTFIIYTITAVLFYFIIYSLYAFISSPKEGFKRFWKYIWPATFTSIATCSSAASIPVNITCTKNLGVKNDIANTTIPLGTSFHKDGSVIGSVFKIMFLVYLFNVNISMGNIILVSLLATLLVVAVPIGGGTISEMLIITALGFPVAALPILTVIATIIGPPATMLNVVGDASSSMLVSRIIDGKNWMKKNDGL